MEYPSPVAAFPEDAIKTLCPNEWVELKEIKAPDQGIKGYVFSHEVRCNGHIVSILPFRRTRGQIEFLLRDEYTPCWGMEKSHCSSITGGLEEDSTVEETAKEEMLQEAGYDIELEQLINLGTCFGTKSSDTTYHLFAVDVSGMKRGEAVGDGSELETKSECYWDGGIDDGVDPMLYVSYFRLVNKLNEEMF
jgi:8-oxo-dGTP pyrophosphatase MutT (NUDIX family)